MSDAFPPIPDSWSEALEADLGQHSLDLRNLQGLQDFVAKERAEHQVFPPTDEVFAALEATPLDGVRAVILGQDPYHDDGQAHGLCFSVRRGVKVPRSLHNIYKELAADIEGFTAPDHGCLEAWAGEGVLLLNTVLTVRAHKANSHRKKGWERFTDTIIAACARREQPMVFVLWGKPAQQKEALIEGHGEGRHRVLKSAHPSPLSARNGFFGSKPFSTTNAQLEDWGQEPIDWRLD